MGVVAAAGDASAALRSTLLVTSRTSPCPTPCRPGLARQELGVHRRVDVAAGGSALPSGSGRGDHSGAASGLPAAGR